MLGALIVSLLVVVLIVNVPALGGWFGFEPMRATDWIWPIIGAGVFLAAFEIRKQASVAHRDC